MNLTRRKYKKIECREHRQMVYDKVLDALIAGKSDPEYLHKRYLKLKEVR